MNTNAVTVIRRTERRVLCNIQFLEPSGELAECVNAYLKNMKEVPSPFLVAHTPSKQQTGEGCAQCHAPGVERGALSESARRGREVFKTGSHHDMQSGDLRGKTSSLNNRELEDLINYVQSL